MQSVFANDQEINEFGTALKVYPYQIVARTTRMKFQIYHMQFQQLQLKSIEPLSDDVYHGVNFDVALLKTAMFCDDNTTS